MLLTGTFSAPQDARSLRHVPVYAITAPGNLPLPDDLAEAEEADVERVLRRAAAHLGYDAVEIHRVSSVIGGSCIACIDVIATHGGTPLLVARPSLY